MTRISGFLSEVDTYFSPLKVFLALAFIFLFLNISPGIYVTDEALYTLMVDSFTDRLSFGFENGKYLSVENEFLSSVRHHRGLYYPQYPKIYPVIASPLYLAFGTYGLVYLNLASFCVAIVVIYLISVYMFQDRRLALLSVLIYSFFTYSTRYALDIWPHSLSAALVCMSVFLIVYGLRWERAYPVFISGFLSGVGFGIRYQVFIYMVVGLTYLAFESRSRRLLGYFICGLAVPLAFVGFTNFVSHASILPGYTNTAEDFNGFANLQVFTFGSFLALMYYARERFGYIKKRSAWILVAVFLAACIWAALEINFIEYMKVSIRVLYAELVDIGAFPAEYADVPGKKLSVLQAAPILSLALAGLAKLRKSDQRIFYLFLLLSVLEPLFFSSRVMQHGGNSQYMRYFTSSLPFWSILAALAVKDVVKGLDLTKTWRVVLVCLFFAAFVSLPFMEYGGVRLNRQMWYYRVYPVALSALALSAYFLRRYMPGPMTPVVLLLLVACATYSFTGNVVAVVDARHMRDFTNMLSEDAMRLPGDCAVFYWGDVSINYLARLKSEKDVVLYNSERDSAKTADKAVEHHLNKRERVYVITGLHESYVVKIIGVENDTWKRYVAEEIFSAYDHVLDDTRYIKSYKVTRK